MTEFRAAIITDTSSIPFTAETMEELFALLDRHCTDAANGANMPLPDGSAEDRVTYFFDGQTDFTLAMPGRGLDAGIESCTMMTVSTANISFETAASLGEGTKAAPTYYPKDDHGFFVHVPSAADGPRAECPGDLKRLILVAQALGHRWIEIDRDAEAVDELPFFSW